MPLLRIDSSYPVEKIIDFCNASLGDQRFGAANMSPTDWENNRASLLYLLYIEKRFDGPLAGYVVYEKDGVIVCGQGFYESEYPGIICACVRTYTIPNAYSSNRLGDINDYAFQVAKREGMHGAIVTFNEYNERYVDGYMKINDPSNFPNSFVDADGQMWARKNRRIYHWKKYPRMVWYKNTKQWVTYHLWNKEYEQELIAALEKNSCD